MKHLILAFTLISLQMPAHAGVFIRTAIVSAQNFDGAPKPAQVPGLDGVAAVSAVGGAVGAAFQAILSKERTLLADLMAAQAAHHHHSQESIFFDGIRQNLKPKASVRNEVHHRLWRHRNLRDEAFANVKSLNGQLQKLREGFWREVGFAALKGAGLFAASAAGLHLWGKNLQDPTSRLALGTACAVGANVLWQAALMMSGRVSRFQGGGMALAALAGAAGTFAVDGYQLLKK